MKFETVRKMEESIKAFTTVEQLDGDIQVVSQGTTLILKNMGAGKAMDLNGAFYMCEETADSFMVNYEQNGNSIKVISTKLSRV